jgi:hypothetical protein
VVHTIVEHYDIVQKLEKLVDVQDITFHKLTWA